MSALLNAGYLYSRTMAVATLARLSKSALLRNGSCFYCSSAPKTPAAFHHETEQNKEDKLTDYQRELIKSIEHWYGLRSKNSLSEGFKAMKTQSKAVKQQTQGQTEITHIPQGNKTYRYQGNNREYTVTNSRSGEGVYGKITLLNKRDTNSQRGEKRTNYMEQNEMAVSTGVGTVESSPFHQSNSDISPIDGLYKWPIQRLTEDDGYTTIQKTGESTSGSVSIGAHQKHAGSNSTNENDNHSLQYPPDRFEVLEGIQDKWLLASGSSSQNSSIATAAPSNKQTNESLPEEQQWTFQDISVSKMSERTKGLEAKRRKELADEKRAKLKAQKSAKLKAQGNVKDKTIQNTSLSSTWIDKMKVLTGQLAPSQVKNKSAGHSHSTVQPEPLKPVRRLFDNPKETEIGDRSLTLGEVSKSMPKYQLTSYDRNVRLSDNIRLHIQSPNQLLTSTGEKTSLKSASKLFNFKNRKEMATEKSKSSAYNDSLDSLIKTKDTSLESSSIHKHMGKQFKDDKLDKVIPKNVISNKLQPENVMDSNPLSNSQALDKFEAKDLMINRQPTALCVPSSEPSNHHSPYKDKPSDIEIKSIDTDGNNSTTKTSVVNDSSSGNLTQTVHLENTDSGCVNNELQTDPLDKGSKQDSSKANCDEVKAKQTDARSDALDDMVKDTETTFLDKLPMYMRKEKPLFDRAQWKAGNRIALAKAHFTSYLEVSVVSGMFSKALRDFEAARVSENTKQRFPVTLEMYNILLRGIANTSGHIEGMQHLVEWMQQDGIAPNLESFAYWLVKVGRTKEDTLKYGPAVLEQIINENLDVANLFNECELTATEASTIISVMRTLKPDLTLKPRFSVQEIYTEPLAVGLNTSAQMKPVEISTQVRLDEVLEKSKIQFSRELSGYVKIPPVWQDDTPADEKAANEKQCEELFKTWRATVEEKFEEGLLKAKEEAWCSSNYNIYPYLSVFPKSEYVDMLMDLAQELMSFDAYYSPVVKTIKRDMGEIVYARYKIHYNLVAQSTKALGNCYEEYIKRTLKGHERCTKYRHVWQGIAAQLSPYTPTNLEPKPWDDKIKEDIGSFLLNILLNNLTFEQISKEGTRQSQKCFSVVLRLRDFKNLKEIQLHPHVRSLCNHSSIIKRADQVPMLCPPLPHISAKFGGNLLNTVYVMKSHSQRHIDWLNKLNPLPVLDSLTILSNSAWVINKPVLDVVLHLFKQGGAPELDIPLHPSKVPKPAEDATRREKEQYKKELNNAASLWYSEMYKYSIAEMFRDEVIWFPHAVDFRGRTYPLSIFNHQGNDVIRGLMKFAESKPLGEEGLNWLKIHLVNLTGLKKRDTLHDRLMYTEEIMDEIADSADNPLTGRKWWMKSDTPVQTLATCMELMNALRSPDPSKFYSNFPVHQDGSCNGLQHYAALGLDVNGAKSVNLYPSERPSDVYSTVTEAIREEIRAEIAENQENNEIAVLADRYLDRKIIKQSVMTQVYGVTRYGVRNQILGQMKDTDCPDKMQSQVSVYLTQKCFQSLDNIFKSGKKIQAWFTRCSRIISVADETVQWVTPINFPVIQSYYKKGFRGPDSPVVVPPVNKLKQTNGFPPNFIHSLDATHMMLTALYCHREGIRFGSVHDSFWTHAGDVGIMNKITREQFVALHKENILQDLAMFFVQNYEEIIKSSLKEEHFEETMGIFMNLPQKGDFNLDLVKDSSYFFS